MLNILKTNDTPISSEYQINDVYNPSHKRRGRFRMARIGTWNQTTGLKMIETETKFQRRQNLGGVTFVAAIAVCFISLLKF